MLPACDLQAVLPECSQLPENVCETHELLQRLPRQHVCSQVRSGGCELCSSGCVCSGCVCSGFGSRVCRSLCSGRCHLCRSVCAQVRSGLRRSLWSGCCHVCGSVCAQVLPG